MNTPLPPGSNPYARGAGHADPGETAPDLDRNAPELRADEARRLNRRALWLLGGIVLVLLTMAAWLVSAATNRNKAQARPRDEAVVIPELPRAAAAGAGADAMPTGPAPPAMAADGDTQAIALAGAAPLPPLPPPPASPRPAAYQADALPLAPEPPSLRERRIATGAGAPAGAAQAPDPYLQAMLAQLPGGQAPSAPQAPAEGVATGKAGARLLDNADTLLLRGTHLRCVLQSRIVTDVPGFTTCVLTEPVYSMTGRHRLLAKGSRLLGRYAGEPRGPRVAVTWDRVITPDGIDVTMSSPGVDHLGGAGHVGDYDAHWGSRIASAMLISLISDAFKYAAAENGPATSAISNGVVVQTPYESATARTMERLANEALEQAGRRPPTVTIHEGTVVNVHVARDVDFSAVLGAR